MIQLIIKREPTQYVTLKDIPVGHVISLHAGDSEPRTKYLVMESYALLQLTRHQSPVDNRMIIGSGEMVVHHDYGFMQAGFDGCTWAVKEEGKLLSEIKTGTMILFENKICMMGQGTVHKIIQQLEAPFGRISVDRTKVSARAKILGDLVIQKF